MLASWWLFLRKIDAQILTLSTTFYDVSVSCNRFSKAEVRQFAHREMTGWADIMSDWELRKLLIEIFPMHVIDLTGLKYLLNLSGTEQSGFIIIFVLNIST